MKVRPDPSPCVDAVEQLAWAGRETHFFDAHRRVHKQVQQGFQLEVVDAVLKAGLLEQSELEMLVISARKLRIRRLRGQALSVRESDRLARVLRIIEMARNVFVSREKADRWLRNPLSQYDGQSPLSLLDTDAGAQLVEEQLGRIAHGLAA